MIILIDGTGANTSQAFRVSAEDLPATLLIKGLAGAEVANIQFNVSGDPDVSADWVDYYKDGAQQQLTTTNNAATLDASALFRVQVPASVGVVLCTWKPAHA